jgi:hypothetical protein
MVLFLQFSRKDPSKTHKSLYESVPYLLFLEIDNITEPVPGTVTLISLCPRPLLWCSN